MSARSRKPPRLRSKDLAGKTISGPVKAAIRSPAVLKGRGRPTRSSGTMDISTFCSDTIGTSSKVLQAPDSGSRLIPTRRIWRRPREIPRSVKPRL